MNDAQIKEAGRIVQDLAGFNADQRAVIFDRVAAGDLKNPILASWVNNPGPLAVATSLFFATAKLEVRPAAV